jgi:hypothetical protein
MRNSCLDILKVYLDAENWDAATAYLDDHFSTLTPDLDALLDEYSDLAVFKYDDMLGWYCLPVDDVVNG